MPQKIYLADDEKNIRDLIAAFLSQEGFEVKTFENGDALLSACDTALPDLVILDIMMPGTDGLSVCSVLRKANANLPIIIVSTKDSPYDRVTGLTLGSDDYLSSVSPGSGPGHEKSRQLRRQVTSSGLVSTNYAGYLWPCWPEVRPLRCASSSHKVTDFVGTLLPEAIQKCPGRPGRHS